MHGLHGCTPPTGSNVFHNAPRQRQGQGTRPRALAATAQHNTPRNNNDVAQAVVDGPTHHTSALPPPCAAVHCVGHQPALCTSSPARVRGEHITSPLLSNSLPDALPSAVGSAVSTCARGHGRTPYAQEARQVKLYTYFRKFVRFCSFVIPPPRACALRLRAGGRWTPRPQPWS